MTAASIKLTGAGMPPLQAQLVGNTVATVAGIGTTQGAAAPLLNNVSLLTTAGGATAFVISTIWAIGDSITVFNTTSTAALIFPPSGGNINGGSTDASVSLAQNNAATYLRVSSVEWITGAAITSTTLSVSGNATVGGTLGVTGTTTLAGATATSVASTGALTSSGPTGAGIGYATGAGGAVTQITSRTTGVTLSKLAGQITTDTSSLAAEAAAAFTVTNTTVAIGDVVVVSIQSGSNSGNTAVNITTVAAGSFQIKVSNNNAAGGTAETGALIINYAVIKSVAA